MSATPDNFDKTKSFLIDTTKCTGCRGCQVACKQWNQLKAENTSSSAARAIRTRR